MKAMAVKFSIKDLERLSGVKAHTLRIWEQRYELLQPKPTINAAAGGVLGLLLGVGVLWSCRAPIALRVMDRGLARTMSADPIAALPDGLHVLLCGAGGPLPDPVRSGPCVAVVAGETMVVVDAGTGGARNLQRMGFVPGRAAAVLLTHFHSDHIDGLGGFMLQHWGGGASKALRDLPVFIGTGDHDFSREGSRALADSLGGALKKNLLFKDYPATEHLTAVTVALEDVFRFFDTAQ